MAGCLTAQHVIWLQKSVKAVFQTTLDKCFTGTGVVTSVPSDSPDDFAALRDLKNKKVGRSYQLYLFQT